ncbi:hypothetical protein ACFPOB_24300 [Bosea eneae]|jgi:hypothetical protein|uniref:Uncharacterized protein n=1 Tax=Bosea eneae TaxID=151454 RepID=A0ABW0J0E4_9HYPH
MDKRWHPHTYNEMNQQGFRSGDAPSFDGILGFLLLLFLFASGMGIAADTVERWIPGLGYAFAFAVLGLIALALLRRGIRLVKTLIMGFIDRN